MAGLMGNFAYTSDDGGTYTIRMDVSNAAAVGNAASAGEPRLPTRCHPRYILAAHPTTGRERRITVGNPEAGVWTSATPPNVSLPDFANSMAATSFAVKGRIGERRFG